MLPSCTCGAVLPEDARFCHKCGKPQYEEDQARAEAEEQAASVPPVAPVAAVAAPQISFGDSRAIGVSLGMAALAFFGFCAVSVIAPPLIPLVFCAAGFVAVRIYNSRSPQPLTLRSGARLGWMTGFWVFLAFVIISALMSIYIADPAIREQIKALPNVSRMPEAAKLLDDPHQFVMSLAGTLVLAFFMATILSGLGGMLGARLTGRLNNQHRPS